MHTVPSTTISQQFATLTDPRRDHTKEHALGNIMAIALCAVICGADDWVSVETFGHVKEPWLRTFLDLPNGIPSHDTFGRVFARLNPDELRRCFLSWAQAVVGAPGAQVVAIDGKTSRRSHDRGAGKSALHLVSAWASSAGLVIGQVATEEKSNEITAIPELLRLLALEGTTITIDAMGCQTAIAQQIVEQGGEYVLALKDNHPRLHERVRLTFADASAAVGTNLPLANLTPDSTHEKGHGRIEQRRCLAIGDPDSLGYVDPDQAWPNLRSIVQIESTRRIGPTVTTEVRHYLSSLPADARALNTAIRSHWGIENRLHWVLDVVFREDDCRVRVGYAPENFAVIRHFALNLLRQEPSRRTGIKTKRLRAALDEHFLCTVLNGLGT